MNGRDAIGPLADAMSLERIREGEKIAAQLRVQILGEFAERLAEAGTLDEARKMLADEIEMQRKLAGDSKPLPWSMPPLRRPHR
jgi:hypothetical protein